MATSARIIADVVSTEGALCSGASPVFGRPGVGVVVLEPELPLVVLLPEEQAGPVIVLWSSVTAACESNRPFKVAPVCILRLVPDNILPMIELLEPRILPAETNLHHTLQGSPPVTVELADVVRVAADLNIHTPEPLSVRFPVSKKASAQ